MPRTGVSSSADSAIRRIAIDGLNPPLAITADSYEVVLASDDGRVKVPIESLDALISALEKLAKEMPKEASNP